VTEEAQHGQRRRPVPCGPGLHGPYRFLSNFAHTPFDLDGVTYGSVEHAYQAAKTDSSSARAAIVAIRSPADARLRGQTVLLRAGWDEQRLAVMARLLRAKFRDPRLAAALVATGTGQLVEENTWGDCFWGACDGRGDNHLGRLLMALRTELLAAFGPRRHDVRLAVVGSAAHHFTARTGVLARQRISLAIWRLRPEVVISGGCPQGGVDIWARDVAGVYGYTIDGGDFVEHRPAHQRWAPDGFRDRNVMIASSCTRLLRLAARSSRTYGSGWTADLAERLPGDRVVVRERL
jgi:ribA/ribD-fused uncharacterized protein